MNKYAYRLADFAKGIKAVRAKGLVHRRNLTVHMDPDAAKVTMPTTKGQGNGPMALTMHGKAISGHRGGWNVDLNSHRKGIYARGQAHNVFNDVHKSMHEHGIASKSMSGGDRKAANHIVLRHEMDEHRALKDLRKHHKNNNGSSFVGTSHLAPSVLLRESNNVSKLGAGTRSKELYHKAKGLMISTRRSSGEADHLKGMVESYQAPKRKNVVFKNHKSTHAPMDYEYGKTRLSRHAIKALDKASIRQGHTVVVPKD